MPGPELGWGQAWWIESESAGRRPGVILTRPEAVPRLSRLLVAFATTTIRGLPSEVRLDTDDGMPVECVLNLDTPELVSPGRMVEYLTTLSEARMHDVCRSLAFAVNC